MSKAMHTPGPWTASNPQEVKVKPRTHHIILKGPGLENIALISSWRSVETEAEEAQANAHLIAAAPDLLEALELILEARTQEKHLWNSAPGESPLHDRCRAAIAKARGQS